MKKALAIAVVLSLALIVSATWTAPVAKAAQNPQSCWGQATKVFAKMGEMGEHAREQSNPRAGLRNLARALYDLGVLEDDSMQSLGAFVAEELGLSIDACM